MILRSCWTCPLTQTGHNLQEIVINDFRKNKCLLIDATIPSDRNTSFKQMENYQMYKDIETEIVKMRNMRNNPIRDRGIGINQ